VNSHAREFDLVLFGATGFTGRLVAAHVAAHARAELRIALAGRRIEVLNAQRAQLMAAQPARAPIGVIIADVSDPDALNRMAARTRAVLSTVGPFVDYGEPLVSACVAQGTDYLDSTGERPFVLGMIARHHEAAQRRGVRLIFSCGFDCVPADLGVYFTVQQLPADRPIAIASYLSFRGSFSGGTERSAIKELASQRPGAEAYTFQQGERSGAIVEGRVHRASVVDAWVSSYFDAVDSNIVLRSASALERYGPRFTYTPLLIHRNWLFMLCLMAIGISVARLARSAFVRAILLKLVKPSGQGPTQKQMDAGWFRVRFDAHAGDSRALTEVCGGDPGYGATSVMLGQCALCLLEDAAVLPVCSGVVTPAQAFGGQLIERLRAHGVQFRVVAEPT
jgi:saccharopine dehydrogenase (NAD+, L-glutamate forming)